MVSCTRSTTFENSIVTVNDCQTFEFSKVVFRLRETTTFEVEINFPRTRVRREMAHTNFGRRLTEASQAIWARDRVELPFFLCNPCGKMTCKIWQANSGLALPGSVNVRAGLAHEFAGNFHGPLHLLPMGADCISERSRREP